jgi:hypothetical protein
MHYTSCLPFPISSISTNPFVKYQRRSIRGGTASQLSGCWRFFYENRPMLGSWSSQPPELAGGFPQLAAIGILDEYMQSAFLVNINM